MGIVIREAVLPADRDILLDTLLRNRHDGENALRQERFEWSLVCNPYGQPRAWLAIDESSGKVIGSVSTFPRRVLINGEAAICWNGGDTSIDPAFRTLGVAIKLRRVVKEGVDRGEMRFLYSHPVDRMRVVLEKIGHAVIGRLARHGVIVRLDRFANQWLGKNVLASTLSAVANPLLRAWPGNFTSRNGAAAHLQSEKRFGDEYDELFNRVAKSYPVIAVRDARFLSWRFLQNPLHREFRIFRLEAENRLRGYAVVDFVGDGARILDFLVEDEATDLSALLMGIVRWLRANSFCSVSVRTTDDHPILQLFRALGPTSLDTINSGIAMHAPADGPDTLVLEGRNWFMTQADRDV
ncbi:MAG: hypothetical protein ACREOI_10485 [bacterium]